MKGVDVSAKRRERRSQGREVRLKSDRMSGRNWQTLKVLCEVYLASQGVEITQSMPMGG